MMFFCSGRDRKGHDERDGVHEQDRRVPTGPSRSQKEQTGNNYYIGKFISGKWSFDVSKFDFFAKDLDEKAEEAGKSLGIADMEDKVSEDEDAMESMLSKIAQEVNAAEKESRRVAQVCFYYCT